MYDETTAWLNSIRTDLPAEALPLAAQLRMLAKQIDADAASERGVTAALSSSYRLTWQSLTAALKGSQAPSDDADDLFSPIAS